ncbi:Uma2 family endonuclease [Aquisphaera insulae]|uniref:Uma2 family endonuclease n=1 Tax=Aquisphaera insulae TaxID=2712864 RepID=UPI0013EDE4F5
MDALTPTLAARPAVALDVEYPDSDGQPMSDNTTQFRWIVTIKEGLESLFRDRADVFVAGDLLWYAVEGQPKIRTAPDAMVVIGRPKGERGSYMQWLEDGVAPQVVFEVHSPGNRMSDAVRRFRFYEHYGVEEYYHYDPDRGELTGWLRGDSGLEEIESIAGFTSPRLGVRFEPGDGPDSLKIYRPDGRPFLTYLELESLWLAERQRADQERQRADQEQLRADRLAAKLREMGIELD